MSTAGPGDDGLDAFLAGQRELAELDVTAAVRAIEPPPGLERANGQLGAIVRAAILAAEADVETATGESTRRSKKRSPVRWSVVALAAAAAAVLAIGFLRGTVLERDAATMHPDSAPQLIDPDPRTERLRMRTPPAPRARPKADRSPPEAGVEASSIPDEAAPLERARPDAKPRRQGSRLDALERRARAQLASGDLDAAESSFRRLARTAGRSPRAELAYGELFTLVRRTKGAAAQTALWTKYLRRFPRGRFADDARAGLCRRTTSSDRVSCWRGYLDDFPKGAHRARARRGLNPDPEPDSKGGP